jgi:hypothetical protein
MHLYHHQQQLLVALLVLVTVLLVLLVVLLLVLIRVLLLVLLLFLVRVLLVVQETLVRCLEASFLRKGSCSSATQFYQLTPQQHQQQQNSYSSCYCWELQHLAHLVFYHLTSYLGAAAAKCYSLVRSSSSYCRQGWLLLQRVATAWLQQQRSG